MILFHTCLVKSCVKVLSIVQAVKAKDFKIWLFCCDIRYCIINIGFLVFEFERSEFTCFIHAEAGILNLFSIKKKGVSRNYTIIFIKKGSSGNRIRHIATVCRSLSSKTAFQARRNEGAFRGCAPPNKNCTPPSEDCAPKKLTGSVLLECKSRPETSEILVIALEFVSKNCFFVVFVDSPQNS